MFSVTPTRAGRRTRRQRADRSRCCASSRRRTRRHSTSGYDWTLGEGISRDPIGDEGGANLYGFVSNDPIQSMDGLGLATLTINQNATYGESNDPYLNKMGLDGSTHSSWSPKDIPEFKYDWCDASHSRITVKVHDWELRITQKFRRSYEVSQTQVVLNDPTQLTLQQHEDWHAWYSKAYTSYAWDAVRILEGQCVCPDCYSAWLDWFNIAVPLAHAMADEKSWNLDLVSYPNHNHPQYRVALQAHQEALNTINKLKPRFDPAAKLAREKCNSCNDFSVMAIPPSWDAGEPPSAFPTW